MNGNLKFKISYHYCQSQKTSKLCKHAIEKQVQFLRKIQRIGIPLHFPTFLRIKLREILCHCCYYISRLSCVVIAMDLEEFIQFVKNRPSLASEHNVLLLVCDHYALRYSISACRRICNHGRAFSSLPSQTPLT